MVGRFVSYCDGMMSIMEVDACLLRRDVREQRLILDRQIAKLPHSYGGKSKVPQSPGMGTQGRKEGIL